MAIENAEANGAGEQPTENYAHNPIGVEFAFPETVTIKMVDASALGDYEFAILLSGFCCNAAVGFAVSAMTLGENQHLWAIVAAVFVVMTVSLVVWALIKRHKMRKKGRTIRLSSSGARLVAEEGARKT